MNRRKLAPVSSLGFFRSAWPAPARPDNATHVFFRMGDFFEMFGEDARIASEILNITLTSRDGKSENAIPLCGFPHFALPGYLRKMVEAGIALRDLIPRGPVLSARAASA